MVVPTAKSDGDCGAKAMDDNFGAGVVVEFNEQAVIPSVKTAAEITARHKLINPTGFLFMKIIYSSFFIEFIPL
jgi:hypothetical protein